MCARARTREHDDGARRGDVVVVDPPGLDRGAVDAQDVLAQRQRGVVVEQPDVRDDVHPVRRAEVVAQVQLRQRPGEREEQEDGVGAVLELVVLVAQQQAVLLVRRARVHGTEHQAHEEGARGGLQRGGEGCHPTRRGGSAATRGAPGWPPASPQSH